MQITLGTNKGIIAWNHVSIYLLLFFLDFYILLHWFFLFNHFNKHTCSFLTSFPYATHLQNWPKLCSLKFVNVMINLVRTINKIRLCIIYSNLNFTVNLVVKPNVYHYVIGRQFESVFDPYYLKHIWILLTHFSDLTENPEYFFFSRDISAS